MRRTSILTLSAGLSLLAAGAACAGGVSDQFRSGAFGVPWNAGKSGIEAHYPGGKWDKEDKGRDRYCVSSQQTLLRLPPPHQTRQLCFLIGGDSTLAAVTARMDASLPTLLAVVNRSRTTFGDFDAVRRDEGAIQSKQTNMLWLKDSPYVVQVSSTNDNDGRPVELTFTVADEASLYASGAAKVSNAPPPGH